ncbi:MFS transporter [Priestia endophytica]|uniref:MFS transporter n=1 Tax=Priestia endophytica TaxID=135735 RepID=UPI00227DAF4C|nr:MFS transporter [Priestia endophytica]MCY8233213.1 MFS transporter [Priestia endophytica]
MKAFHSVRDIGIFAVVSFLFWFSQFIYVPIFSPYMSSLGGNYAFIGLVLSSYGLMQLFFRLPLGIFSDLTRVRKPFIILGMLASSTSCLLFTFTDSLTLVFISRCLAGFGAATWVAFTILYGSYFKGEKSNRAMNSISFIVVLAQLLGMMLSGYVVSHLGWHGPFWIGSVSSLIGLLLSFMLFEDKQGSEREPIKMKELLSVMRNPTLLKISFLSILAHSIIFSTMFGFTPNYALNIGLTENELTFIVFSFMIPHAIAPLVIEKVFLSRFREWTVLKLAFLTAGCFTCLIPFTDTKLLLCIIQSVNGFSLGIIFPLMLGMSVKSIPEQKKATAMGAYQALYAIGIFAGPFFAGLLNSHLGIEAGFYFAGSLGIVATLAVVLWRKKTSSYEVSRAK